MAENTYGVDIESFRNLGAQLAGLQQEQIPVEYWHGYLTAIALAPTAIPEREWIGALTNRNDSADTAEIEDELREALKSILEALTSKQFKPYFPGDDSDWRSCQPTQWCEGFLTASHHWPGDLQEKAAGELVSLVLPIVIFHNPGEYFETMAPHMSESEGEELMDQSFSFLANGLYELPALWQEVLQESDDDEDEDPYAEDSLMSPRG